MTQPPTVLIVDDSKLTRTLLSNALHTRQIFDLRFAEDGEEAMAMVEGVDLILCDWVMPKMDGLAFTRWLRGQEAYQDIPLILITANFDDADLREARDAGVSVFIEKTFSQEDLDRAIDMVMGGP